MENIINSINSIDGNYTIIFLIALFYSLERILGTPFIVDRRLNHFFNNFVFMVAFYFVNLSFAVIGKHTALFSHIV